MQTMHTKDGIYNFLTGKQNLVIYGANLVGNFG
jgi:hypothetical protein